MTEPGWLLESTYVLGDTHTFFGRAEQVRNSELFGHGDPLHGQEFRVRKLSLGYIYDFARTGPVKWGIGGLVGFVDAPRAARSGLRQPPALVHAVPAGAPLRMRGRATSPRARSQGLANASVWPGFLSILSTSS